MSPRRALVVISGPIGAGKSSVAEILARRVARRGSTAVLADLDDVAFMQRRDVDLVEFWRRAGTAHCALVRAWFAQGVDVVIAHGPFFESDTYEELFATAPPGTEVRHVLLDVAYERALERVSTDRDRRSDAISRDPEFLRSTHDSFRRRLSALPDADLTIDTTDRNAAAVSEELLSSLFPELA